MNNLHSPDPNPYSAPQHAAQPAAERVGEAPRIPRPLVVTIAAATTTLSVLMTAYSHASEIAAGGGNVGKLIAQVVFGGLLVYGLFVGHRLAWQWTRLVSGLLLVLACVGLIGVVEASSKGRDVTMTIVGLVVLVVFGVVPFALLSVDASYAYFRLVCPQCQRRTTRAADFFFRNAKCKACNLKF